MFSRKKKEPFSSSYTVDFSDKNTTSGIAEAFEEPETPELSPIDKLVNYLAEQLDDSSLWNITDNGVDNDGYIIYILTHVTKPVEINFSGHYDENDATFYIDGDDIGGLLESDSISYLTELVDNIIENSEDQLADDRVERNNKTAQKFLDVLSKGD